jgi:peroxiredoxin
MKKQSILPAAALVLVLSGVVAFLVGGTGRRSGPEGAPVRPGPARAASPGMPAPEFSLTDISGNRVASSRFLGKPTVINFFATWCPPCREEIPGFVAVHRKYRDRGFEMIGISLDTDTRSDLPGFIARNRIEYRILFGDLATILAYGGGTALPTTVFIGKDGVIRDIHVGFIDGKSFEREVRNLL